MAKLWRRRVLVVIAARTRGRRGYGLLLGGRLLGLEKLMPSLAPPNEVNTDEHAKTTKTLYFNSK
jgi:hypothetical protein